MSATRPAKTEIQEGDQLVVELVRLLTARGLKVKPFAKPAPVRAIGAVWRKSTPRGKAIDAVIAALRAAMKEEPKR